MSMAMPAPDMVCVGIAIVQSGSPLQPEVGEGGELVFGEAVAAGFLVAEKYAEAYGCPVGHLFDVLPPDDGLPLSRDVLPKGRDAAREGVGALRCPCLRTGSRWGLLGPCSRFHVEFVQAVLLFGVEACPVAGLPGGPASDVVASVGDAGRDFFQHSMRP